MPTYESPDPRDEDGNLFPSLGAEAVEWMEDNLTFGPGDLMGQPYRLEGWQQKFVWKLYAYDPATGRRIVRRALLGLPKGSAKSELAAACGLFELAGPCVVDGEGRPALRNDPEIVAAAASARQANLVYGAAFTMAADMAGALDRFQYETQRGGGESGRLYRVAAEAATNDGLRPTTFIADEVHEWLGRTARVHLVIANGLTKRRDSLELNTTTAGADLDTVAGRLYEYGKKVATGEVDDASFLMYWAEGPEDIDFDDPAALRAAIAEASPASWTNIEAVAKRHEIDKVKEHEFRRYYLNQWREFTEAGFLPAGAWGLLEREAEGSLLPPRGAAVVLGFDGSWKRDSTALFGWTVPEAEGELPYGFEVAVWENHDGDEDWLVPRNEVATALREAFGRYDVRELACDPYRWEGEIYDWSDEYGDIVTEFPTNSRNRMAQACDTFYGAVVAGALEHDGSPAVARHLHNAITRETANGAYITKQSKNSPLKIDVAVAAIIGFERATFYIEEDEYADVSIEAV